MQNIKPVLLQITSQKPERTIHGVHNIHVVKVTMINDTNIHVVAA